MLQHLQAAETQQLTHKVDSFAATAVAGLGFSVADINPILTLLSLLVGIVAGGCSIYWHILRIRVAKADKREQDKKDK